MFSTICYHLHNFKKREKHPLRSITFSKTLLHGCFSCFLNCTNGTKSHKMCRLAAALKRDSAIDFFL